MSAKKSLADKISGLLNAAPSYNPDEEDIEATAKVVDFEDEDGSKTNDNSLSTFRKKNANLLEDVDAKYAGKKLSRKDLQDSDDDLPLEHIDQESDSEIDEEEGEGDDGESFDEDQESDEQDEEEAQDDNFKHMKAENLKVISKKSHCVQNQIRMWESLLEMRIQLQKSLTASNRLPRPEIYNEMKENHEFTEKTDSLKLTLGQTLAKMMELQELLVKKFPESKNVLNDPPKKQKSAKEEDGDSDEEIPSDTEEEQESEEESNDEDAPPTKKKKFTTTELEDRAKKFHNCYKNFRNTTIQKWNDKTQISHGKTANANSVLKQIEFNLSDKARIIKRTQLKRSEYRIIGVEEPEIEEEQDNVNTHEYNNNIFDDDDFYHQLLRELIEVKSADITDPIQLSRQWIQLQNLRSKMKRKIDTKATKGRKIRYGIHTKLVNFMAPINNEAVTDEAQTELFSSLFGKKIC